MDSRQIFKEIGQFEGKSLQELLKDVERNIILGALKEAGNNVSLTARRLKMNRGTLINRLKAYKKSSS